MQYCSKCGAQLSDDSLFCTECGQATREPVQPTAAPTPPPVVMASPVAAKLKSKFSSALMLMIAIFATVAAVLGFIGEVLDDVDRGERNGYYSDSYDWWENNDSYDWDDEERWNSNVLSQIENILKNGALVIFFVFLTLVAIASWILFASAKNQHNQTLRTGGFTLLRVTNVIGFVFLMIAGVLWLMVGGVSLVAGAQGGIASFLLGELDGYNIGMALSTLILVFSILILVLAAVFIAFTSVCFAKAQKTIGSLKNAVLTGVPAKVSPFIGVMCFIIGGCYVVDALASVTAPVTLLYSGCVAALLILCGCMLFSIRKEMDCFVPMPANQPVPPVQDAETDAQQDSQQ